MLESRVTKESLRESAGTMRLNEIADLLDIGRGPFEIEITDLVFDSRSATPGSLFFCWQGKKFDGHDFATRAIDAGAAALVCERRLELDAPQLIVRDSNEAMNRVAGPFFGYPSQKLRMAGVTGTNGKTTTTYMLQSIFSQEGPTGLIGTIEVRAGTQVIPGVRTTPQSADLQRLLKKMVDAGFESCAMEATSVGIEQGRIDGCDFDICVFTNLSQDHLDDHGAMEAYFQAKRALFQPRFTNLALVNADNEWGQRMLERIEIETKTYGMEASSDFTATDIALRRNGSSFRAIGPNLDLALEVHLPARFNLSNALAAAAAAHLTGVSDEAIAQGLGELAGIPGRFQFVEEGQDFTVVVDYAHTPDGLEHLLMGARGLMEKKDPGKGRVIVVFGCGGNRDKGKRPLMGKVAGELSDIVYVTSDNPRSENPGSIIAEIERGFSASPSGGHHTVPDRAEAIESAIREARAGDVVVIAGKGHETGQEFADWRTPFDDVAVATEAIKRR